ncbi:MAG TPA: SIR2 family protein, partial [Polyangia bacterium]|nr:SIR2 family protein [Polyangia bacterium]
MAAAAAIAQAEVAPVIAHGTNAPAIAHATFAPAVAVAVDPNAPSEAEELAELLRAGRSVLCAGSRIAAGQSSLQEALAQLAKLLPDEEADAAQTVLASRPLAAAAFIRRRLAADLPTALATVLDGADAESDRIRLLAALPFRAAVTTTWDDALDRALGELADGTPRGRYTPYDAAALRADTKPFVLHALGDPRRPETLLWSNEELQAALSDGELRTALHDLYRTRSFLFVGFDTRDLDFQILVERLLTGARTELTHYAILPGLGAIEQDELWASWRIRVLAAEDIDQLLLEVHEVLAVAPERPADDDGDGWLAVLAADPTDLGAAAHLDRIADELRERGDHDALVELLLGRVGIEPTAARRAEMLSSVARIFEYEADDAERALTALLAAYKEEPAQADWHELERLADAAKGWDDVIRELAPVTTLPAAVRAPLHRKAERWADMLRALDELAADGLDDAPMLRLQAAALTHEKLGDVAGAIVRYEALAESAPHDVELLRLVEPLYREAGRNADFLTNLARQADATPLDA